MTAADPAVQRYLTEFERLLGNGAGRAPAWLRELRIAAIDHFASLGFPTTRHEEWKYTNVAPLTQLAFQQPRSTPEGAHVDTVHAASLADAAAELVFVNGRFAPALSATRALPSGARAESLAAAVAAAPERVQPHLAQHAAHDRDAFVALNTALMQDGAFVHLPAGCVVPAPIHLLFVSAPGEAPAAIHPRNLIVLDADSQATVIETYVGCGGTPSFTNAITEVSVGPGAVGRHCKLQDETRDAFHIATLHARLARSSTFASHALAVGGRLVRNSVHTLLDGAGTDCTLDGLFLATDQQHVDNYTVIEHVRPHGTSRELYKGVLDGRARGVFNGKIHVHPAAAQTDARQTNKNLLLSTDAAVDTKPQLEIYNNDVKCSHGSTVGQLDADALFYLRTRGLDPAAARALLIYAFASEMLARLPVPALRARLEPRLLARTERRAGAEARS
jgi:Fe-S cluster assembly protein SufD